MDFEDFRDETEKFDNKIQRQKFKASLFEIKKHLCHEVGCSDMYHDFEEAEKHIDALIQFFSS